MIKNKYIFYVCFLIGIGCTPHHNWKFDKEINLKDSRPTGLVVEANFIWLSDVENNRIVKLDLEGKYLKEYGGIQRPMHLTRFDSRIYVPEYTTDTIIIISDEKISILELHEKPDAPGGIAVSDSVVAIADFYNHRVIVQQDEQVLFIGKEGHERGELYYPTDVEIYENKIYVADTYNNRIQVFDMEGISLQVIGDMDGINVATGITVVDGFIFVADFEGNRVLVYNLKGKLMQVLTGHLDKPSDIAIESGAMYVTNYGTRSIAIFE